MMKRAMRAHLRWAQIAVDCTMRRTAVVIEMADRLRR
jgi:hypothetical protein